MGIVDLHFVSAWDVPDLMRDAEAGDDAAVVILCGCSYFKNHAAGHAYCAVCREILTDEWPYMIAVGVIEAEDKLLLAGMCSECGRGPNPKQRFAEAVEIHGRLTPLNVHPAIGHA